MGEDRTHTLSSIHRLAKQNRKKGMNHQDAMLAAIASVGSAGRQSCTAQPPQKEREPMITSALPAVRNDVPAIVSGMTADQIELIKRTIAKGATDDELQMFLHIANRTGLDPFARQIYAVKRWDKNVGREVMAVQTGIDGYRLVADRTEKYAPGREPTYAHDDKGKLETATAYVKKLTRDGQWHEVAATAHFAEYAQTTKEGKPTRFWQQMPHVMLAKVAEALALRRAFPMELSGIYTADEMAHIEIEPEKPAAREREADVLAKPDCITKAQAKVLVKRAELAGHSRVQLLKWLKVTGLAQVKAADFDAILARVDNVTPLDQPVEGMKTEAEIPFEEPAEREPGDEHAA